MFEDTAERGVSWDMGAMPESVLDELFDPKVHRAARERRARRCGETKMRG
jgi:hypothetical protein